MLSAFSKIDTWLSPGMRDVSILHFIETYALPKHRIKTFKGIQLTFLSMYPQKNYSEALVYKTSYIMPTKWIWSNILPHFAVFFIIFYKTLFRPIFTWPRFWKIRLNRLRFSSHLVSLWFPSAIPCKNLTDSAVLGLLLVSLWSILTEYRPFFLGSH